MAAPWATPLPYLQSTADQKELYKEHVHEATVIVCCGFTVMLLQFEVENGTLSMISHSI